LKDNNFPYT